MDGPEFCGAVAALAMGYFNREDRATSYPLSVFFFFVVSFLFSFYLGGLKYLIPGSLLYVHNVQGEM